MSWEMYFQERWSEFIKDNFATNEQCAVAFGVTAKQADNWRRGISAPRGHHVAKAFRTYPEHAHRLIGANA